MENSIEKTQPLVRHTMAICLLLMVSHSLRGDSDLSGLSVADQQQDGNCSKKGHRLYGRIQFVTSFPDIKAQVVTFFPDLKVKIVEGTHRRNAVNGKS